MRISVVPPPTTLLYPEIEETKEEQKGNGNEATTALDEACHDCWQRSLLLARQGDDGDTASSAAMVDDDEEGMGNPAKSRVLREISANRVVLPPQRTDSGVSSTGQT